MSSSTQKPKILIIDDAMSNIKVLGSTLQADYKIIFSLNAEDGLKSALANQPDLILLDILMPGMDGYEACRRLKADERTRDIPVIFITSRSGEEDEVLGFELGGVDYIRKPFRPVITKARVKTHLDLKQRTADLKMAYELIRQIFGRYLSEEIVNNILESPKGLKLGGEKREVTILLSDLRGFSSISERLAPETVLDIINGYFRVMTDILFKHNATIDEFIGDSILAIFGAPLPMDNHAEKAMVCALEMQIAMETVNARNQELGYPYLEMGIGLNSGEVVVGNIGSEKRTKYGIIGKNVNLASRIESFTYGGQILISSSTKNRIKANLDVQQELSVSPKGITDPIVLYDIKGIGEPYSLHLPDGLTMQLSPLNPPLAIKFSEYEDKCKAEHVYSGNLSRIGKNGAVIQTKAALAPFTNIQIRLLDESLNIRPGEIFAKVLKTVDNLQSEMVVRFTHITPETRSILPIAPS